MEGFREVLRAWAGKRTEGARGRLASLGAWIKERKGRITPRRALAAVVALSLWMGVGRMDSSESVIVADGEVFGEVHWYEG